MTNQGHTAVGTTGIATSAAIEVRDLRKAWGEQAAVDSINFTAPAGEFTVLLGPSGCGKSTTLRLIAGLEEATSGAVLIGGDTVTDKAPNERQIAMVFQSYALFPHLSVAENILFGLKVRRVPTAERAERLQRTAALLGLESLLHRRPSQISGGATATGCPGPRHHRRKADLLDG
jgi:sn-glycerol 3-phosphate transport system ATP-binding protein